MLLVVLLIEILLLALLLGFAGRADLPWIWAVIGVHAAFMIVCTRCMDPDLRRERLRKRPGGVDRYFRVALGVLILAHLVVAGLDIRFSWSAPVPVAVRMLGLIGYIAGMALGIWAMCTNRFFAPAVRIQHERGHSVVTDGPYRFVRHPGYLGMLLAMAFECPVFGSWWAMLPVIAAGAVLAGRTAREDRILHEGLPGYAGYASRVRSRLLPGVW